MDKRNHMGKATDEVIIPVAPIISEMSDTYLSFIDIDKSKTPIFQTKSNAQ